MTYGDIDIIQFLHAHMSSEQIFTFHLRVIRVCTNTRLSNQATQTQTGTFFFFNKTIDCFLGIYLSDFSATLLKTTHMAFPPKVNFLFYTISSPPHPSVILTRTLFDPGHVVVGPSLPLSSGLSWVSLVLVLY